MPNYGLQTSDTIIINTNITHKHNEASQELKTLYIVA